MSTLLTDGSLPNYIRKKLEEAFDKSFVTDVEKRKLAKWEKDVPFGKKGWISIQIGKILDAAKKDSDDWDIALYSCVMMNTRVWEEKIKLMSKVL